MRIAILKETAARERRVALTPDAVKRLAGEGHENVVERGAGTAAYFLDSLYEAAGASLAADTGNAARGAHLVARVQRPRPEEVPQVDPGAALVTLLQPAPGTGWGDDPTVAALAARGVTAFALERVPRISRAQSMDVLSSQATVAGYKAVLLGADRLARPSVPVEQAAALAIAGMTARALMRIAQVKRGETALVIGATGGVGGSLLPLLAQAGAHTVATARSEEGRELVSRLGADEIVGHDPADYPENVDVVFNLALFADQIGGAARSLRPGGKMVTIMFPPATVGDLGRADVEFHFLLDMDGVYGGMQDVAEAAASGVLTVEIAEVFPFERAVDAMVAYAAAKVPGKIVVSFS